MGFLTWLFGAPNPEPTLPRQCACGNDLAKDATECGGCLRKRRIAEALATSQAGAAEREAKNRKRTAKAQQEKERLAHQAKQERLRAAALPLKDREALPSFGETPAQTAARIGKEVGRQVAEQHARWKW